MARDLYVLVAAMVRVLVADGDVRNGAQIEAKLSAAGVACDVAGSGRETLHHLRKDAYALMLLDLELSFDAHAVLEYLRQMPADRRPIVIVSGSRDGIRSTDVDIVQMILRKPLRPPEVVEMICSCVRQRLSRRTECPPERSASSALSIASPLTST